MPNAKKDDVNIVQIESEGFNQEKVCFHIDQLCSAPILMLNWQSARSMMLYFSGESSRLGNEGRHRPSNLRGHSRPD